MDRNSWPEPVTVSRDIQTPPPEADLYLCSASRTTRPCRTWAPSGQSHHYRNPWIRVSATFWI